jgi:hypothetical protein
LVIIFKKRNKKERGYFMYEIKNYEKYNVEMDKSIIDKLFFVNELHDIDIIVDYGCGDGSLLRTLLTIYPNIKGIGIDYDYRMIEIAKSKSRHFNIYYDKFFNEDLILDNEKNKKIAVIFSSVLHEIYCYHGEFTVNTIFKEMLTKFKPTYIIIRDMISPSLSNKIYISEEDIHNLYLSIYEHQAKQTDIGKIIEDLYPFSINGDNEVGLILMKYKYFLNGQWEKEKNENYFSYKGYKTISNLLFHLSIHGCCVEWKTLFYKQSRLNYINNIVKNDFGVEYPWDTHWYGIYEITYE